ncbi:TetR/AcrR family transcriptional regulator [Novosphingobium sp.]|uniref:TetR/AcrR family transcriptional regulator n=1 Tax=Novosphingobium sp. TaxID=1874826 RepID=UPI00260D1750|nr:TetR/AcrR family transcriptional regulator [Novosphingobium sp.]
MKTALRNIEGGPRTSTVRHNLAGQRLGRKGQETRERILSAALQLLEEPDGPPVTLSSVARAASMRLTNLYLYFPDFGELLLAVLGRVMDDGDAAFMNQLKVRWPDDRLGEATLAFISAHFGFWKRHARLLHLRNALSDSEPKILQYRQNATRPIIEFLVKQMDGGDSENFSCTSLAVVALTGFERIATVVTNPNFRFVADDLQTESQEQMVEQLIAAEARLLELAIRDRRAERRSEQSASDPSG